jgi:hypothetical protein
MSKSKRLRTASAVLLFIVVVLYYTPHQFFQPPPPSATHGDGIDWKRFAYVQYVTNTAYLCNSVMLFESLHRLGTKAEKLMMYPSQFAPGGDSVEGKLLAKARDVYGVKLTPVDVQRRTSNDRT